MDVGRGIAVTQEAGVWKFMSDMLPIQIHASTKVQRTSLLDSATRVHQNDRALAFKVAVVPRPN